MSVYVDPLAQYNSGSYHGSDVGQAKRTGRRNGHWWCHLFADSEEELHAFADALGLVRYWYQGDHYDLTPPRRAAAVNLGALEVDRRELAKRRIARRKVARARDKAAAECAKALNR